MGPSVGLFFRVVLVKESWVWLVGLLVHLCGKDLLKKLGDAFGFCGGG